MCAIKGAPSVPAIVEFMHLWNTLRQVVPFFIPCGHLEIYCQCGAYSAKSAYNLFFLARLLIPCAKEL
jgi:hypothetical protein